MPDPQPSSRPAFVARLREALTSFRGWRANPDLAQAGPPIDARTAADLERWEEAVRRRLEREEGKRGG
jgi:hypothetical protein